MPAESHLNLSHALATVVVVAILILYQQYLLQSSEAFGSLDPVAVEVPDGYWY